MASNSPILDLAADLARNQAAALVDRRFVDASALIAELDPNVAVAEMARRLAMGGLTFRLRPDHPDKLPIISLSPRLSDIAIERDNASGREP